MRKRVTILALVLCLTLTACGGGEDSRGQTSFLGAAAGIQEDAVLLTVDGREVLAWRYLYWLAYTCDRVRERYEENGLKLDWDTPLGGGTLADYARDQALADTALYATVENWAERYDCGLTGEDQIALDEDWAEKAADHGGEEAYLEILADMGLDQTRAKELSGVGQMYAKLYALSNTADSALAPDREALEEFAAEQGLLTVDRILVSAGADKEAARRRAAEIFSQLNSAADQTAKFTELAAAGDDTTGPRTLSPGDGVLDTSLEEAAGTLAEGQCSGILESGEGFSILLRLPTAPESVSAGYFDQRLQSAAEGAAVETAEEYGKLDIAGFYRSLQAVRAADHNTIS